MRIAGDAHLTYCTNIHAGESIDQVMAGLATHLPEVRRQVAGDAPMGVGLRLGAQATEALADPARLEALKGLLDDGGFYVFTVNGFPYGTFHGATVKEGAYRPDWSDPLRLEYTNRLASLLAQLLPEGMTGSLSTVPCTFKPWAAGRLDRIVDNLIAHVAHLVALERETGKSICLALEPEPFCFLETIAETVEFFEKRLYAPQAIARLAAIAGLTPARAAEAMRRHVGVCYDVCHAAVEFEDAAASIAALRASGIRIAKAQLSSALRVACLDEASAARLAEFDEPTYLHQVVERRDGALRRFADLPEALAVRESGYGAEWRVHFHVPVFLPEMVGFGTTQAFLAELLALHAREQVSQHLEVETYTWDVLPEAYRNVPLATAIARELDWVKERIG
ncbi:metabolite traffic protein EboE [Burkholderiaceae bacterium FT117]|uniref:metabolite traffic protein EboE n=1 Tax=Zeimonas sediminis TaxID=2944268 RepID=UPI0023430E1C|nr:metabolite traffic protein EboE [Zeimonas sediminis]MCM5569401.1 metabolite traffic protein EboE [Zeimonas sediminis]